MIIATIAVPIRVQQRAARTRHRVRHRGFLPHEHAGFPAQRELHGGIAGGQR